MSVRTSVGVYTTDELAGDHLGLPLLPDPPTLLRLPPLLPDPATPLQPPPLLLDGESDGYEGL